MNLKLTSGKGPGLEGHLLLLLSPFKPPAEWLDSVKSDYPGLEVVYRELAFFGTPGKDVISSEEWGRVTILLTGSYLPPRDVAPKLEYVQLISAGANQILDKPLFLDTDIAFCTANGVHG